MKAASAVEPASTMEASATVESAATVKVSAAMKTASAMEALAVEAAIKAPTCESPAEVATPVKSAAVEAPMSIKSVEPRSRADEDSTDKPIRAVVAVGRASVRIIIVVAVGANRRRAVVRRPYSYPNEHALGVRVGSREEADPNHRQESEKP